VAPNATVSFSRASMAISANAGSIAEAYASQVEASSGSPLPELQVHTVAQSPPGTVWFDATWDTQARHDFGDLDPEETSSRGAGIRTGFPASQVSPPKRVAPRDTVAQSPPRTVWFDATWDTQARHDFGDLRHGRIGVWKCRRAAITATNANAQR
jgi:hypothetical protein